MIIENIIRRPIDIGERCSGRVMLEYSGALYLIRASSNIEAHDYAHMKAPSSRNGYKMDLSLTLLEGKGGFKQYSNVQNYPSVTPVSYNIKSNFNQYCLYDTSLTRIYRKLGFT